MKGNLKGPSVKSIKLRQTFRYDKYVCNWYKFRMPEIIWQLFSLLHMKIVSVFNGAALRLVRFIGCNVHCGMETSGLMRMIMMTTTITPRNITTTTTTTKTITTILKKKNNHNGDRNQVNNNNERRKIYKHI